MINSTNKKGAPATVTPSTARLHFTTPEGFREHLAAGIPAFKHGGGNYCETPSPRMIRRQIAREMAKRARKARKAVRHD